MGDEMTNVLAECERLSDADLVRTVKFLADRARHSEFRLLAHIAEFDARRLCLEEGFRSAYDYCTGALGFDEQEAYRRIRAARLMRAFPEVYAALRERRVTVSALIVLSPWLQKDNVATWITAAEGKSKRQVESLVAASYPQSPQPDHVRNLTAQSMIVSSAPPQAMEAGSPEPRPGAPGEMVPLPVNGGPPQVEPIAADRVRIGFDAASRMAQLIERMRQLLRHKYPEGRLEDLIKEALESYLDRKDPLRKLEFKSAPAASVAETPPHSTGRYIPARVKSQVWARDQGRCAWRKPDGTACGSKDWIEYDHVTPYARGGRSDDPRNLRLVCRQHNQAAALAAGFSVGPKPS